MDLAVKEAAQRLGVHESRVRQLLLSGDLKGRRVGRSWLVASEDVARLEQHRRQPGRPIGPRRAWGLLDLLSGGHGPWLSYSERSQVRSYMARLDDPDPDHWRAILRGRSAVIRSQAHPAAIRRLREDPGVLSAGPEVAVEHGFDLLLLEPGIPEIYVDSERWPSLTKALAIREDNGQPNLVVRVPHAIWPFVGGRAVSDAMLAADLLDAAEPRAVSAGGLRLQELLRSWRR